MSEQSNASYRLFGLILLIIGGGLLVAQFFILFIFPAAKTRPVVAQAVDEKIEPAVAQAVDERVKPAVADAVAAAKTAGPDDGQALALDAESDPAFAIEPVFEVEPVVVVEPVGRAQFDVLDIFRMAGGLVAFVLLGVGISILRTRKGLEEMEDPPVAVPEA